MQQSETAPARDIAAVKTAAHFFMSAHTPSGFVSRFDRLYDATDGWKAYILKGVPGKTAQIIAAAGKKFENAGIDTEYIHCISEPDGAAAVVLPHAQILITDGMPPHCIVPKYPGIVEDEIMLYKPCTEKIVFQREKILQFAARASAFYDRVYRFLSAAASLQSDTFRIASENLDIEAVEKYACSLAKRSFSQTGKTGKETKRYLSGITANGIVSFSETIDASYERVFAIEDNYGVGKLLLSLLGEKAMEAGYDVINCICPIKQGSEHLLIPSLSMAFVTSNNFHRVGTKACRHINIRRFMDCDSLRLKKARIGFNRRACRELYNQAASLLREAKANEDIVKSCYECCVKTDSAQEKAAELVDAIIEKYKK